MRKELLVKIINRMRFWSEPYYYWRLARLGKRADGRDDLNQQQHGVRHISRRCPAPGWRGGGGRCGSLSARGGGPTPSTDAPSWHFLALVNFLKIASKHLFL